MDPLSAIAAFNASYAIVKTAAQNAGEISDIFAGIGKMLSAKQAIEKAAKDDPEKSDLELYANHVEMEQKWQEVVEMLKWTGHWDAYQKFVQDRREAARQERLKAVRERQRKVKMYQDIAVIIGGIVASGVVIAAFLWAISTAKGGA